LYNQSKVENERESQSEPDSPNKENDENDEMDENEDISDLPPADILNAIKHRQFKQDLKYQQYFHEHVHGPYEWMPFMKAITIGDRLFEYPQWFSFLFLPLTSSQSKDAGKDNFLIDIETQHTAQVKYNCPLEKLYNNDLLSFKLNGNQVHPYEIFLLPLLLLPDTTWNIAWILRLQRRINYVHQNTKVPIVKNIEKTIFNLEFKDKVFFDVLLEQLIGLYQQRKFYLSDVILISPNIKEYIAIVNHYCKIPASSSPSSDSNSSSGNGGKILITSLPYGVESKFNLCHECIDIFYIFVALVFLKMGLRPEMLV
jgi:hypothetical protein